MEQLFSSPTCFSAASVIGPDKLFIVFFSLAIAGAALLMLRKNNSTGSKIALIYTHLTFLLLPFFLLTTNATCGLFCLSCHNSMPALFAYAVPATLGAAVVTGFIAIPHFFAAGSKKLNNKAVSGFIKRHSLALKTETPKLFVIDRAKPFAFSFRSYRSAIFMSAGLLDILRKKEIEAVLLHELYHIKAKSSALKLSAAIARVFSPFSLLVNFHDSGEEEKAADKFAADVQGTARHVNAAKRKINSYTRTKDSFTAS